MSTFTKEQLIARINQVTAINKYRIGRDPAANGLAMDNELLAIALESLEAEPVAFRSKLKPPAAIGSERWDYTDHRQPDAFELENCVIERLYTAPLESFGNSEQLNSPGVQGGWAACSERMPESNKYVLVCNGVWVGMGLYNDGEQFEDCERWQDEHGEFIDLLHHPVSHWMPLPETPQQEGE